MRRHESRALALAGMLLGDADDARDAVQDAFVKAYRSVGDLIEGREFGPWFRTILRNLCIDRLRSRRRRGHVPLDSRLVDRTAAVEAVGTLRLEREQLADLLHAALDRLSVEHRDVLVLKEIEGMSYAAIAEVTGVTTGTVASRLHHARAALRAAVGADPITATGRDT